MNKKRGEAMLINEDSIEYYLIRILHFIFIREI